MNLKMRSLMTKDLRDLRFKGAMRVQNSGKSHFNGAPTCGRLWTSGKHRRLLVSKSALQAIVDMPDRLIDLFIRLCVQNKGVLSASKRKNHFSMLTDEEVAEMQQAIKESHLVE
jgi:hypothetical protein